MMRSAVGELELSPDATSRAATPPSFATRARALLDPLVRLLVAGGVSASSITTTSLLLGVAASLFVGAGAFLPAAVCIATSSLGDALDGAIARATRTATASGALYDAAVDRYEEFMFLAAVGVLFRARLILLLLVLAALCGSFMVSYGSAKAEALGVKVPPGSMRRAGRAFTLTFGTALAAAGAFAHDAGWISAAAAVAPLVVAVAILAVSANVSAVRRLRAIADAARR